MHFAFSRSRLPPKRNISGTVAPVGPCRALRFGRKYNRHTLECRLQVLRHSSLNATYYSSQPLYGYFRSVVLVELNVKFDCASVSLWMMNFSEHIKDCGMCFGIPDHSSQRRPRSSSSSEKGSACTLDDLAYAPIPIHMPGSNLYTSSVFKTGSMSHAYDTPCRE